MLSRRALLAASAACGLALPSTRPRAEAILTEDGLYRQPWFLESFAIVWELRGCPYCKQTHLVNFARPEIETFIKERFDILQLNIVGSREVTDFDGWKLPEKELARKYGVRFTPTFQFFPESPTGLAQRPPREREVARVVGYQQPEQFLATFRFVVVRGYEKGSLEDFLKARS